MNLEKLKVDILRAIALYQEEHNGNGMPNDNIDILTCYIQKVNQIN